MGGSLGNNCKPFVVVHLSDLHLTETEGMHRSEPKLFGHLKGMNAAFRKIVASRPVQSSDLILVTGDVTDKGDLKSWENFWTALDDVGVKERVLVVPGNHDVCCLGVRMPYKEKLYSYKDLEKVEKGLRMGGQLTKFPWVKQPDPRLVVFGLNSNNLGNATAITNAVGYIGYYQLKALAGLLHKYRYVPVKIVALHHSPNIPEQETAVKRGQRPFTPLEREGHQIPQDQRHGLNLLCVTHRVRLLLHGHLHMNEDRRVSGIRYVGIQATTDPQVWRQSTARYCFSKYSISSTGKRVQHSLETIQV